uniref:Gag-pol polyprotein n=1 Tax=Solanum tuberosum TaxID=4113 RepID=M1DAH2_SOLTU
MAARWEKKPEGMAETRGQGEAKPLCCYLSVMLCQVVRLGSLGILFIMSRLGVVLSRDKLDVQSIRFKCLRMADKPRLVEMMPPRRAPVRRNMNVEPEAPQALVDALAKQVTHAEFRTIFQVFVQAMTSQANHKVVAFMNPNVGTIETRVQDLTRMNPLKFHGSKVDEDPQEFVEGIQNIIHHFFFNTF